MLMKVTQTQSVEATKQVGEGIRFERTRRITGYLVGTLDRFNDAKRAEEKDRVKHQP
jgi:anaerobic ribonucleoside-triphosphate reductase